MFALYRFLSQGALNSSACSPLITSSLKSKTQVANEIFPLSSNISFKADGFAAA